MYMIEHAGVYCAGAFGSTCRHVVASKAMQEYIGGYRGLRVCVCVHIRVYITCIQSGFRRALDFVLWIMVCGGVVSDMFGSFAFGRTLESDNV